MRAFFLISCILAAHRAATAQSLDPCEALNVIDEAEADIVAVLKHFNKTLAANKQTFPEDLSGCSNGKAIVLEVIMNWQMIQLNEN
ncbi:hypothetical protein Btru_077415 [Bulinus truncatus]|nr:hypothetical protein Btru_077415 [Bulinus truncatus]